MGIPGLRRAYERHTARRMAAFADDQALYKAALSAACHPGARALHFGGGWDRSGVVPHLAARGAEVLGVETDARAAARYPAETYVTDGTRLPFGDAVFHLVASEYVFEHLPKPGPVIAELARVLHPGGALVLLTPNRWSYKSLVAALSPHGFHEAAARHLRPDARNAEDVYPTYYRINTVRALRHHAAAAGFTVERVELLNNGPTWFRRLPGIFEAGLIYHRMLEHPALAGLRCGLLATLRRRPHWADVKAEPAWTNTSPLVLRCTHCTHAPMEEDDTGARCPACGHRFVRRGRVVTTH